MLEMSSEPAGRAALREALRQKAYPAREGGGFVWIWMGPGRLPSGSRPHGRPARISAVKMHAACNWAQVLEGSIDSAHSSSLHSTEMPAASVDGAKATQTSLAAPFERQGAAPAVRADLLRLPLRRDPQAHPQCGHRAVRAHDAVHRALHVLIPPNDQYHLAQMLVPLDDVNTMFYWVAWHPDPKRASRRTSGAVLLRRHVALTSIRISGKAQSGQNRHLQDRDAMKRGDFTGIRGIPTQDMAMWESMGPISDRSRDQPGRATWRWCSSAA